MRQSDYQVLPPLSPEEYADLRADIAARGVMIPIEVDEHGNVLDGHHRIQICRELGIGKYPKLVRIGLTEDEKWTHVRQAELGTKTSEPGTKAWVDRGSAEGNAAPE